MTAQTGILKGRRGSAASTTAARSVGARAEPGVGRESIELLVELLHHGFDRASWHGANLAAALRGVDAPTAARRVGSRKTIWEQALHAAYWKHRVLNKLAGRTPFSRKGSNWPRMPAAPSESAWRADLDLLRDTHRRLVEAVTATDGAGLSRKQVQMIHGAAFHDIYHAGQVKLLRRLLETQ